MTDLLATLKGAGFKGEALKTAWAIAKRESGGRADAYNPDRSTGDDSYGLFQINMLGNLGPSRRKSYGLSSNRDLLDPATNARVAYAMSKGGSDFGAWGIGPNAYRKMPALNFSGYPGEGESGVEVAAPASVAKPKQVFDPSNPFSSVVGGELEDNPFAGISPTRKAQSIFPEQIGSGSADYSNPFAAIKVPPPKHGKTSIAPVGMVVEGNGVGAQAVKQAARQLGKPYVFGSGPDESSFDCSDLVQWSYRQLGIEIPRDTVGQQAALPLKSWADLQPGDPIYRRSGGHVVIYAGNGKVIAAPHTGTVVQYQSLSNFPADKWEVRSINP